MNYEFDFDELEERTEETKVKRVNIIFKRYNMYVTLNDRNRLVITINDNNNNHKEVYKEICGSNKFISSIESTYKYYKSEGINVSIDEKVKNIIDGQLLSTIQSYPR